MKFISVSYRQNKEFKTPETWLYRIRAFSGILEVLSVNNIVISIDNIAYKGEYFQNGVSYFFGQYSKIATYLPFKLHRFIKKQKPDVVLVQGLHHPLQIIQLRLALGKKTKIIAHHHAEKPFTGIKKQIQRKAGHYVDAFLFASHAIGMDWVDKGNITSAKKIHEIMEVSSIFYPIEKTEAKLKTHALGHPIFLWVGRLNANKDPLNVVKAFLKYVAVKPDAHLYMIYHTEELLDDIKALLNNTPNENTITLIGKIPNDDLLYWYNSADFLISGSFYEGSGTAVCEAMSCGCIPLVTDIPSFRMITDNGDCGLLYEAGNEEALFNVLVSTEQIDLNEKRNKSLAFFKNHLSFEAIATQINGIANKIMLK